MIRNLGGAEEAILNAGHHVMLSQPEKVAALLDSIAAKPGRFDPCLK